MISAAATGRLKITSLRDGGKKKRCDPELSKSRATVMRGVAEADGTPRAQTRDRRHVITHAN